METLQAWGADLIVALQSLHPALDGPMSLITTLGSADFFTLLIPLLYWCVSAGLGARFVVVLLAGDSIVNLAKLALHSPRPYWVDSRIRALAVEESYGVPSGHAQSSLVAWGFLALSLERRWAWVVAVIVVLLVGLSRLYVGVHYPHDVLAGWLIGAAVLGVYGWAEPRVTAWLARQSAPTHYAAALVLPAAILLAWAVTMVMLSGTTDPAEWERQAALALPPAIGATAIDPRNAQALFANVGVLLGAGLGLALARGRWQFDAGGPLWKRAGRFVLGIAVLLALRFGLGAIFPETPLAVGFALRVVRYAMIGAWVTAFAPAVFLRFGLAEPASVRRTG